MANPLPTAASAKAALRRKVNPKKAKSLGAFFQAGRAGYGAGDRFLGLTVPQTREVAKSHRGMSIDEIAKLLPSPFHEDRLLAVILMGESYTTADERSRAAVFKTYIQLRKYVDNWDLVDASAPHVVGRHLEARNRAVLYKLARSKSLWDRRIAIVSTFHFIRCNDFKDTLAIAKILLHDEHDLIHKAVGWMLREMGKRDQPPLDSFLNKYCRVMPRTMLRYAIEKYSPARRRAYLAGDVESPA